VSVARSSLRSLPSFEGVKRAGGVLALLLLLAVGIGTLGQSTPASSASLAPPIRAAFYYPWFPETWGDGTHYHPTLGQYDSSTPSVIASHIASMKGAGHPGRHRVVVGPGHKTDGTLPRARGKRRDRVQVDRLLRAGGLGRPVLGDDRRRPHLHPQPLREEPRQWLRVGGKPVMFVYGDGTDGCAMVDRWIAANRGRFYLNLKVFGGYRTCANQPDSWHQYAPSSREDAQLPYSYSISPGFYKSTENQRRASHVTSAPSRPPRQHGGIRGDLAAHHDLQRMGRGHGHRTRDRMGQRLPRRARVR
jgi:hypothetical protein